jgi:hypothetical protein
MRDSSRSEWRDIWHKARRKEFFETTDSQNMRANERSMSRDAFVIDLVEPFAKTRMTAVRNLDGKEDSGLMSQAFEDWEN